MGVQPGEAHDRAGLEAERDYHLQLGYYEHSPEFRMDYRNGYRLRDLATQLGLLRRLRVPRTRRRYRSQFLPRYKRAQPAVHELVRQAFLRGISTRQVGAVLEPVLGEAYSAQTVSNLTRELSRAAEQFHGARCAPIICICFWTAWF